MKIKGGKTHRLGNSRVIKEEDSLKEKRRDEPKGLNATDIIAAKSLIFGARLK